MPDKDGNPTLTNRQEDYIASAAKAILGTIPFVGSLLVEIAGVVIPNQRIDRITKFAETLAERLSHLEQGFVATQVKDEGFTDLVEEGLRQAARSLSDERREYIASIIANSLTSEEVEYQESKHLLRILGEINDVEVIWLRFYLMPTVGEAKEFRARHKKVLEPVHATIGASKDVHDKAALQDGYKQHLSQLGLLAPEYMTNMQTKQPEYDSFTGAQRLRGYRLTPLGRLLLREIGFGAEDAV